MEIIGSKFYCLYVMSVMKVVILCGGKGTRLREETEYRPKPMVPIGGKPILWHIMKYYAYFGHNDFIKPPKPSFVSFNPLLLLPYSLNQLVFCHLAAVINIKLLRPIV